MPDVGQTTPSGGREASAHPDQAPGRQVTVPNAFTIDLVGVYAREQTTNTSNTMRAFLYALSDTLLKSSSNVYPATMTTSHAWRQITFTDATIYPSGNYAIFVAADPATSGTAVINGQNDTAGLIVQLNNTDIYSTPPASYTGLVSTATPRAWDMYLRYVDAATGTVNTIVLTDNIEALDAYVFGTRRYRLNEDLLVLTEGPTEFSTIWVGETTDEGLNVVDFQSYFLRRNRDGTDIIVMTDAVTRVMQFVTLATDVLIAADGNVNTTLRQALITDSVELVDEYLRRMLLVRLGADNIIVIDSFTSSATGQQIISALAEDLIVMTSEAFANLYRNRGLDDSIDLTDSRNQTVLRSVVTSSAIEILDQAVMQFIRVVQLTDTFDLIDSVSALLVGTITVNPTAIRIGVDQPNIILGGYVV